MSKHEVQGADGPIITPSNKSNTLSDKEWRRLQRALRRKQGKG